MLETTQHTTDFCLVRSRFPRRGPLGALLAALLAALLLTACGGGGGGGTPVIDYPDPVEELTEADMAIAGIPALPLTAGSSVRSASAGAYCEVDSTVASADAAVLRNLVPTAGGLRIDGVPATEKRRIIAAAMYELPGAAGNRIREISLNVQPDPGLRVFMAVGNFSAGRWEPVPQRVDGADFLTWQFSTGPRYNRPGDGSAFLLLLLAHPGHGDMNGLGITLTEILISSFDTACLAEGFEAQTPGSVDWGDGVLDFMGTTFDDTAFRGRQSMVNMADLPFTAEQPGFMFPQPLDLAGGPKFFDFQSLSGDFNNDGAVDGADFLYFDPGEINGVRHPYRLILNAGAGGGPRALGFVPTSAAPGGGPEQVLIGLLIPAVANVTVNLGEGNDTVRTAVTDARGRFLLPHIEQLPLGDYTLSVSGQGSGDPIPTESISLNLMEEEGIFYFLTSDPNGP